MKERKARRIVMKRTKSLKLLINPKILKPLNLLNLLKHLNLQPKRRKIKRRKIKMNQKMTNPNHLNQRNQSLNQYRVQIQRMKAMIQMLSQRYKHKSLFDLTREMKKMMTIKRNRNQQTPYSFK